MVPKPEKKVTKTLLQRDSTKCYDVCPVIPMKAYKMIVVGGPQAKRTLQQSPETRAGPFCISPAHNDRRQFMKVTM